MRKTVSDTRARTHARRIDLCVVEDLVTRNVLVWSPFDKQCGQGSLPNKDWERDEKRPFLLLVERGQ